MQVQLRPVEAADRPALRRIRNDMGTQAVLLAHPEARTDCDDVDRWIERRSTDPDGRFYVVDGGGACLGFVQLTAWHRIDGHAHFGIALLADARGSGVGMRALEMLQMQAAALGLRKLLCEVRCDNSGAIALYKRCGFSEVGTLRQHYNDGERLWDVVLMEALLPVTQMRGNDRR